MIVEDTKLLELAVQTRFLTRKQAGVIHEELAMFPGERVASLMLRRHFVTEEQLQQLKALLAAEVELDEKHPQGGKTADLSTASDVGEASSVETEVRRQVEVPLSNQPKNLVGYLRLARHWGCSDLHLSVGRPPFVRLHGQIRYMEVPPLTAEQGEQFNFSVLSPDQRAILDEHLQIDFALEIPGVGRHRCNIFRQRLGWDGAYRIIRQQVPTLEELGLPAHLRKFTEFQQGLVMVTGPAGSGKTTTCAALLGLVNNNRHDHIITVEDPIEFILPPKSCQVTQREVGRHTHSFASALRAALREDPDIILVGELRDLETTSIAISAAETGHLVLGTLHTSSAARTVARIVDVYPVSQQTQVCVMVAESLRGVITQQLIPRKGGQGAVMALEILVNHSGVATQIKDQKTHLLPSLIQSGKKMGMITMEESLMSLYRQGLISGRDAYRRASNKVPFEAMQEEV